MVVAGCATAYKMNSISLGMTKAEVVKVMGSPTSTSAKDGVEYLNYKLYDTFADADSGIGTNYYVRLVGGKVESYGRLEDKSTIDLNITNK